jgi:hypothetical protein
MHHQPGGFVHHQQVRVLVDDIERNRLGGRRHLGAAFGQLHADFLAAAQAHARRERRAVHGHPAVPNPCLQAASGEIRQQRRQHLVEPLPGQLGGRLI